jgi:LysR family transcriptional regulator, nitrogen assimilation regulatory protein
VAQPALTRRVQQLESELGTPLLQRLPRGVRLTSAGLDFLEHARRIIHEVARAREHVHGRAGTASGRVVMGTSPTLAPLLLPGCVARARRQCPSITLKVVEGFSPQLLEGLLAGRLDLAVMTNPPRSRALALTPLISEPLLVLAPPGRRGTARSFSLAELSRTPVLMSAGMRAVIDEQLASLGTQLRVETEVDSVESIRRLLLAGVGVTVMPVSMFQSEIREGRVAAYPIDGVHLQRILVLARPVAERRSAAIDAIEHVVRAEMTALLDAGLFRLPTTRNGHPAPARPASRRLASQR